MNGASAIGWGMTGFREGRSAVGPGSANRDGCERDWGWGYMGLREMGSPKSRPAAGTEFDPGWKGRKPSYFRVLACRSKAALFNFLETRRSPWAFRNLSLEL